MKKLSIKTSIFYIIGAIVAVFILLVNVYGIATANGDIKALKASLSEYYGVDDVKVIKNVNPIDDLTGEPYPAWLGEPIGNAYAYTGVININLTYDEMKDGFQILEVGGRANVAWEQIDNLQNKREICFFMIIVSLAGLALSIYGIYASKKVLRVSVGAEWLNDD